MKPKLLYRLWSIVDETKSKVSYISHEYTFTSLKAIQ